MRVSVRKMLVGLLAMAFIACARLRWPIRAAVAATATMPITVVAITTMVTTPGFYYRGVRPVVVAGAYPARVYTAPALSVQLRNPAENRVTLSYIVNGSAGAAAGGGL